jgi:hypothetical protein
MTSGCFFRVPARPFTAEGVAPFHLTGGKENGSVARLHLEKIGVKLDSLSRRQARYLGIPQNGPFKPEHYRY